MKKIYTFLAIFSLPAILLLYANSGGSQGGYSGSPGDMGNTCVGCHSGNEVINQDGWITTDIPAEGYTPGQTYLITLTGMHENVSLFGFELTSEDNSNTKTGEFAVLDDETQLIDGNNQRVTHTSDGITPSGDTKTWEVNWTAPASGSGTVTFWAALNAANGNGNTSGDQIYTTSLAVDEASLGIGDLSMAEQVSIYPNPVGTTLNLQLPESGKIRIVDMLGNEVMDVKDLPKNRSIDVSTLTKGIYFVQVMIGNEVASFKMLKN